MTWINYITVSPPFGYYYTATRFLLKVYDATEKWAFESFLHHNILSLFWKAAVYTLKSSMGLRKT